MPKALIYRRPSTATQIRIGGRFSFAPWRVLPRFWSKVDRTGDCWVWTGARHRYGHLTVDGRSYNAHKFSYLIHKGAVPRGRVVRHTCDNPLCVCPDHLVLGSQSDNVRDMFAKGRQASHEALSAAQIRCAHPRRKLNASSVREIRRLLAAGRLSQSAIGRMFGVPQSTISAVKLGRTWAHLE